MDEQLREKHFGAFAGAAVARYPSWVRRFVEARHADVLIIARKAIPVGPPFVEIAVGGGGVPFVYDFDDAIHLKPPDHPSPIVRLVRAQSRCRALCRVATTVTVGNEFLAEFARQHAHVVRTIPTTVDVSVHEPRTVPKDASARPVVGWSGSPTTVRYLEPLLPVLREVQRAAPFDLLVVGAQIHLGGVVGRCVPWTSATEVPLLQEMDVGLMPLPDGPWERGKCGLKALLYQAVGIPAVVSDVGVNRAVVKDGTTGFVVPNAAAWRERIEALVRDRELRRELGSRAREHVSTEYSSQRWVPEVAATLRAAAECRRS
jgi:glycosyltransferase involved in cell wall biosynthesis